MHKWIWRGETGCGGSCSEDPQVTGYLEAWFHYSLRFNSNSCCMSVWTGGSFLSENLISRDQLICSGLGEKLQIFAALSALSGRTDASLVDPRLLVQPHSEDVPQAAVLLAAALQEGEIFDTPCAITNNETLNSWSAFCLLKKEEQSAAVYCCNLTIIVMLFLKAKVNISSSLLFILYYGSVSFIRSFSVSSSGS